MDIYQHVNLSKPTNRKIGSPIPEVPHLLRRQGPLDPKPLSPPFPQYVCLSWAPHHTNSTRSSSQSTSGSSTQRRVNFRTCFSPTRTDKHPSVAPVSTAFPVNAAEYTLGRSAGTFVSAFKNTGTRPQRRLRQNSHHQTRTHSRPPHRMGQCGAHQPHQALAPKKNPGSNRNLPAQHRPARRKIRAQRYLAPTASTQDHHPHHSGSRVLYTQNPGPLHPQVLGSPLPEATPSPVSRPNQFPSKKFTPSSNTYTLQCTLSYMYHQATSRFTDLRQALRPASTRVSHTLS